MYKKMKPLLVLGAFGILMIVIYMINLNYLNINLLIHMLITVLTTLVLVAYYFSLGFTIYKDSKNILKAFVYQTVPLLTTIFSFILLSAVIGFNIKVPSLFDLISLYAVFAVTYFSPMWCFIIYYKLKQ